MRIAPASFRIGSASFRINDFLLDALADRWPAIEPDWANQNFEAWLAGRLRYYNEYGYPRKDTVLWYENFPPTLWDYVEQYPPADFDVLIANKAAELRRVGGTMIQRVKDLKPFVKLMLGA